MLRLHHCLPINYFNPVVAMVSYLHGGGLPFVAARTINEKPETGGEVFLASTKPGLCDASITLAPIDAGGGKRSFKVSISPAAQGLLVQRDKENNFIPGTERAPKLYSRLVDLAHTKDEINDADSLKALAQAMHDDPTAQSPSTIPAAYTYLGQFIAHDITSMQRTDDLHDPENYRTHAFDLDSLFGPLPEQERMSGNFIAHDGLCLGETLSATGRYEDLPRSVTGFPCIADPRNDNNLAVAQLTVLLTKFHHVVCRLTAGSSSEDQRAITRQYVQSVVLHDYLKRIIHPDVYSDVMTNGRQVILPKLSTDQFRVPIEFAAACFRFGHTMVREEYKWVGTAGPAPGQVIRRNSHLWAIQGSRNRLEDYWVVDWARLLDDAVQKHSINQANIIGGRMSTDLMWLDARWIEGATGYEGINLAKLTLQRGRDLAVSSGQMLHELLTNGPYSLTDLEPLTDEEICSGPVETLEPAIQQVLIEKTPLWYYTLREAQCRGNGGAYLGPMASRVVMETIHAAIEAAPCNIVSGVNLMTLAELKRGEKGRHFTLQDIVHATLNCPV